MTAFESDLRKLIRDVVREELAAAAKPPPEHVTVAEYARARSISQSTVRAAIREGRLSAIRIGRAVRVPAAVEIRHTSDAEVATARANVRLLGGSVG